MPGHWPLRTFLELGALPGAVPCARLHARLVAWEWGLTELGDDAELLVSELLTNAVAGARAMEPLCPVRLWLLSDTTQIAILVWDANPQPPVRTQVDDDAETGRGLLLVEAVSQQWGWYAPRDTTGKVVWALTRSPSALCPGRAGRGLLGKAALGIIAVGVLSMSLCLAALRGRARRGERPRPAAPGRG